MKIAHVVSTFPPLPGGMGRVAYDEATALAAAGHDVTVFTGPGRSEAVKLPFKVARLPAVFSSRAGAASFSPTLFFRLTGFDIVHLHYPWYGGAEWVAASRFFKRQKYIITYHMAAGAKGVERLAQIIYDGCVAPFIFKLASRVMVVDSLQLKIRPGSQLLENAVNTDIFNPEILATMENNELIGRLKGKTVVLFVGNFLPVKRFDLAIEALVGLPSEVVLLAVGGGYDEAFYKKKAREMGVSERVLFTGATTDELTLARYYALAAVTVIPSDRESFSLVCLESWATGTPVIASDLPVFKERVSSGIDGQLFSAGSAQSLAAALREFFKKNLVERKRMGEKGREKVLARYSLKKHIGELEKIYFEVISKG